MNQLFSQILIPNELSLNMNTTLKTILLLFICTFSFAQDPVLYFPDLSIQRVMYLPNHSVRLAIDETDSSFYSNTFEGTVQKITKVTNNYFTSVTIASDTQTDINYLQGLAVHKGVIYLVGNHKEENKKGYGLVVKGVKNANGTYNWITVVKTESYPSSTTLYDHAFSNIIVTPDSKYLLVTSGSRTDHGEIQSTNGLYPNTREVPLTSAIFKFPINTENLLLPNTFAGTDGAGYVFARGVRNTFDMAYDVNNLLYGVENSGDSDASEELNLLTENKHYGFPWVMGTSPTLQQYANYNPANDKMVNHLAAAWERGYYTNDPTYPSPPAGVTFSEPVRNYGPEADKYRDADTGEIRDASDRGEFVNTFTGHRSPLGLVFDTKRTFDGIYNGKGFMLSYSNGQGLSTYSPFNEAGSDLLMLDIQYANGQPTNKMYTYKVADGFAEPVDALIVNNKLYVLQFNGHVWEISIPNVKLSIANLNFKILSNG